MSANQTTKRGDNALPFDPGTHGDGVAMTIERVGKSLGIGYPPRRSQGLCLGRIEPTHTWNSHHGHMVALVHSFHQHTPVHNRTVRMRATMAVAMASHGCLK